MSPWASFMLSLPERAWLTVHSELWTSKRGPPVLTTLAEETQTKQLVGEEGRASHMPLICRRRQWQLGLGTLKALCIKRVCSYSDQQLWGSGLNSSRQDSHSWAYSLQACDRAIWRAVWLGLAVSSPGEHHLHCLTIDPIHLRGYEGHYSWGNGN
jgi:hypothetical protein